MSRALLAFHDGAPSPGRARTPGPDIEENHRCNTRLWDEEDLARRRDAPDAEIVANKRAIDALQPGAQRRGRAHRRRAPRSALRRSLREDARLHSETAGMMIDRLSILALKVRAMRAQAARADADEAHRAACRAKLTRLEAQRADLAGCLDALLADCAAGRARFKVYRQFKMYNDPALNPHLEALASEAIEALAATSASSSSATLRARLEVVRVRAERPPLRGMRRDVGLREQAQHAAGARRREVHEAAVGKDRGARVPHERDGG